MKTFYQLVAVLLLLITVGYAIAYYNCPSLLDEATPTSKTHLVLLLSCAWCSITFLFASLMIDKDEEIARLNRYLNEQTSWKEHYTKLYQEANSTIKQLKEGTI